MNQNEQNDPAAIFTPFTPAAPPEAAKPERQKRRRVAKPAKEKPVKRRRRRVREDVEMPSPDAGVNTDVTISTAALVRLVHLKEEDIALFKKLSGILSGAGQKQRHRVLEAITNLFA